MITQVLRCSVGMESCISIFVVRGRCRIDDFLQPSSHIRVVAVHDIPAA